MARSHLRVYYGPETELPSTAPQPKISRDEVTLSLEEVLPLLADAAASQRTWLRDFEDDKITISTDLYEVLLAYRHFRRPSA